jgi:hypothetical protein
MDWNNKHRCLFNRIIQFCYSRTNYLMVKKIKNIISLLLLVVFLLPTLVKLEHQHKLFSIDLRNEKHNTILQDNCPICNFEFSLFISNTGNFHLQNQFFLDNYFNNYNSRYNSNFSQFSFLLRAPPIIQI